jgi:hypothetical protein
MAAQVSPKCVIPIDAQHPHPRTQGAAGATGKGASVRPCG